MDVSHDLMVQHSNASASAVSSANAEWTLATSGLKTLCPNTPSENPGIDLYSVANPDQRLLEEQV
jgi:hypothetical protein